MNRPGFSMRIDSHYIKPNKGDFNILLRQDTIIQGRIRFSEEILQCTYESEQRVSIISEAMIRSGLQTQASRTSPILKKYL
ncbi:hypothetical protein pb186bvf_016346 [Paramecium bursaria]